MITMIIIMIIIIIIIIIIMIMITGHDVNFCSDLPRRASEIQFSLALLHLSLALENCMFYNISFKTK